MLYVAKIDRFDLINNIGDTGPALTVWFSGCTHRCDGCHNIALWDRYYGEPTYVDEIIDQLDINVHRSIVLIGGEPLDQNMNDLIELVNILHTMGIKIWLYTGYYMEDIPSNILFKCHMIKTGKYVKHLKQNGVLASSNQKMFNIINTTITEVKL